MTTDAERRDTARPEKESRHRAREAAVQMLYQWEIGRLSMLEVRQTFWTQDDETGETLNGDLRDFAMRLADGVASTSKRRGYGSTPSVFSSSRLARRWTT